MQILITNIQLDHRTGTEIVVRDLEAALRRRGHDVCVFTERPGIMSEEIARNGGRVVTDLRDVPFIPDVIHGHHNTTTTSAARRFPTAPVIYVCHSRDFWMDMARGVPSVHRYVAVDLNCRERLLTEGIPESSIELITNAVDLDRMRMRPHPGVPPQRAAVFGNNAAEGGFVESIRRACERLHIELDEFGSGVGRSLTSPERVLADYDVVFAKARCAIEAMTAGCAVIAIDRAGYGGLVTMDEVDQLLDWNVGDRCLQRRPDIDTIVADLQRIDADDAAAVTQQVRDRCDLRRAAERYEHLYVTAVEQWRPDTMLSEDPQRSVVEFANELEGRLRTGVGWDTPELPPSAALALRISIDRAGRAMTASRTATVDVAVTNGSRELLTSAGSRPLLLSYHWIHGATGEVAVHDGMRTRLTVPIPPGGHHRQSIDVLAPDDAGAYVLRVTLVQESIRWFSQLSEPVVADVEVHVAASTDWHVSDIAAFTGLEHEGPDVRIDNLGFVSTPLAGLLTFAGSVKFLDAAIIAGAAAVIVPRALGDAVPSGTARLVADDPAGAFWRVHEALLAGTDFYGGDEPTRIDPTAQVDSSARIEGRNVRIGAETEIGAGCVITGRVDIAANVKIGSGSVIGSAGFQTLRVDGRSVEFSHAGGVVIGDDARIFSNATIARGLFRQNTVLGGSCRVGNNAVISHNTQVGPNSVVGHGAVINGNVEIGSDAWVGPGACVANNLQVGNGARIDLGATLIGNLQPGEHVGGPPAIDHRAVLREVASWRRRGRRT